MHGIWCTEAKIPKKYVIALILSSVEMVSLRYDIYSNNVILL